MEEQIIIKWLSLKSTIESIGEWEILFNPDHFGMWISSRFQISENESADFISIALTVKSIKK